MKIEIEDKKWPKVMWDDGEPRREGIHLSDVMKSLQKKMGTSYSGKGFEDMALTAEIGFLWERVLSKVMGEKYAIRPPQLSSGGIWMSPDGFIASPRGLEIEEYKATWKSANSSPADNWNYMTQVKAYCRAMETNLATMRIFHVMGNYRGSGPLYRVARLEFSQGELDQNWDMIVKEKERMEGEND